MDLGGAPLAYTPFCESRKEIEGFRFWKSGFWAGHLQGRPYHIRLSDWLACIVALLCRIYFDV